MICQSSAGGDKQREPKTAASTHPRTSHIIRNEDQLRALIGEPAELTCAKVSDRLNPMTRLFIERSPFVCMATSDLAGQCAFSPRGDPAGFDEAYTQCSKAFLRSQPWDAQRFVDAATMPTGSQVHRATQGGQFDVDQYDLERAERYRRQVGFY